MTKRKAQSGGESEAGGRKRSRSEKSKGMESYDSPTNKHMRRGGQPYETGYVGEHYREEETKVERKRGKGQENSRMKAEEKGKWDETSPHPRIAMARSWKCRTSSKYASWKEIERLPST